MTIRNRTVLGHHGTTSARADEILSAGFEVSENEYDWLGYGIYFFEDSSTRAAEWANENHPESDIRVVEAEITLSRCLNLADPIGAAILEPFYELFVNINGRQKVKSLKQTSGNRQFDCSVINLRVAS